MRRPDSRSSLEWFEKAQEDLKSANVLFKSEIYNQAGFHCQQAAEKCLKGYLYSKGNLPGRVHDLKYLLRKCAEFDAGLYDFKEECKELNAYYIPIRYPVSWISLSEVEAGRALEIAENIFNYVKDLI